MTLAAARLSLFPDELGMGSGGEPGKIGSETIQTTPAKRDFFISFISPHESIRSACPGKVVELYTDAGMGM